MTNIMKSIRAINPNAKVTVYSEDGENIVWDAGTTPISKADILAKQKNYKLNMMLQPIKEVELQNIPI